MYPAFWWVFPCKQLSIGKSLFTVAIPVFIVLSALPCPCYPQKISEVTRSLFCMYISWEQTVCMFISRQLVYSVWSVNMVWLQRECTHSIIYWEILSLRICYVHVGAKNVTFLLVFIIAILYMLPNLHFTYRKLALKGISPNIIVYTVYILHKFISFLKCIK